MLQGGLVIACADETGPQRADVRIRNGLIVEVGADLPLKGEQVVDASNHWILPGFVQTHIHLCQTLFRCLAEDRPLLSWLSERIWPLEAAHNEESTYLSARLGIAELLLGGTTAIQDMGSLRHTDASFQACADMGIWACAGRALMDEPNPAGLHASAEKNLMGACEEADRWHNQGRLRYAFAPRFVPSCSEGLLRETVYEARRRGARMHTHASENLDELQLVQERTGMDNVAYLASIGLVGPDVGLAHCIHLSDDEVSILAETQTRVLHCPSSNMKLASGIAPVPELLSAGVHVSLGADGAPCNNRLDVFSEMRHAGLLQSLRRGPGSLGSREILRMATLSGAEALGLEDQIGSIVPGKSADLVVIDANAPALIGGGSVEDRLVYAAGPEHVSAVYIGGEPVVEDGALCGRAIGPSSEKVGTVLDALLQRANL